MLKPKASDCDRAELTFNWARSGPKQILTELQDRVSMADAEVALP